MGWGSVVFPLLIITPTGGFTGLFLYSPGPGQGNLIGSWTAQAGTDPFGNPFPAGINVTNGVISGVTISAINETLQPGPLLLYGSLGLNVQVFTTAGSNNWVAPAGLVGSAIDNVICIGAGGGGDGLDAGAGESGGGGGACSILANVAVTIGNTYHPFVGTGGAVNTNGTASTFAGDSVTVTANPGSGAVDPVVNPPGGAASTTPAGVVSFAGGAGGGSGGAPHGGGGGGGAASDTQAGNPGIGGSATAGGAGGAAARGSLGGSGGAGARGGNPGASAGAAQAPGGGGGGGGSGGAAAGSAGANGQVVLIYRTSPTVNLLASVAANAGTDPNTGTAYTNGFSSYDPTFGDAVSWHGANYDITGGRANFNFGDLAINTVGQGLRVAEGANARQGRVTLAAGTSGAIANTTVTANTHIWLSRETAGGGALGDLSSTRVVGTSFTINSNSAADVSTVSWLLTEPA